MMKQKDIALIAIVVIISGVVSFILSGFLFGSPSDRREEVEVVEPITADFTQPDKKYFNENSIDPTQLIRIGESSNSQPFSGE